MTDGRVILHLDPPEDADLSPLAKEPKTAEQSQADQEEVIEDAIIEATDQISDELSAAGQRSEEMDSTEQEKIQSAREKVVPLSTRFILMPDGSAKVEPTAVEMSLLKNLVAGGARLYAMPLKGGDQPVPITVDQFFNGTDEEILSAVMHRTSAILEAEKSSLKKLDEAVDLIQGTLDALAFVPVVGDVAAAGSGLIDLGKGNPGGAALSFATLIPIGGEAAAAAKVTRKMATALEDVAKVAKIAKIGRLSGEIVKAVRSQIHHIATYFGEYGKEFEALFRQAGITGKTRKKVLDYAKNLMELAGHNGGHTEAYRKFVYDYLKKKVGNKTGRAAKKALDEGLAYLRRKLTKDPSFPYK